MKYKPLIKLLARLILFIIIVICSIWFYDRRMSWDDDERLNSNFYMGTWVIVNQTKPEQYEFEDSRGQSRLIVSKQQLIIWSSIGISWPISQKAVSNKNWDLQVFQTSLGTLGEFDYGKRLWMKWYQWVVKATSIWDIQTNWKSYSLLQIRKFIYSRISQLYGTSNEAWLLLGMLVGSKSLLSKDEYQWFISSWLVHLIAVSGGNIMMLSIFLGRVLFWMPYYVRLFFISLWIIGYGTLCGWDSSVIRAVIMGLLGIIALYGWRLTDGFRMLGITAICMLLWNPYLLVYDLWFSLSFSAVLGLMITSKARNQVSLQFTVNSLQWDSRISRFYAWLKKKWLEGVGSYLIPCLWANLWVLPVLILFSWQYNLTSIVWNLIVQFFIPVLMLTWSCSLFLSTETIVWSWLYVITKTLLKWIFDLSDRTNSVGYGVMISWSGKIIFILIIVSLLYVIWNYGKKTKES